MLLTAGCSGFVGVLGRIGYGTGDNVYMTIGGSHQVTIHCVSICEHMRKPNCEFYVICDMPSLEDYVVSPSPFSLLMYI